MEVEEAETVRVAVLNCLEPSRGESRWHDAPATNNAADYYHRLVSDPMIAFKRPCTAESLLLQVLQIGASSS